MALLKYSADLLNLPMNMIKDLHFDLKGLSSISSLLVLFIFFTCLVKETLSIINLGRQNLFVLNQ